MLRGSDAALTALQTADDIASGLPSPSSKLFDGRLENYCGSCGHHPVAGPETRYRCPACGLTADEYHCECSHVAVIVDGKYPNTEIAEAIVSEAKGKSPSKRTAIEKELAAVVNEPDYEVNDGTMRYA